MPEISSSRLLQGSPQHIYQSLFRICKLVESLSFPLSILQIHARCEVLCLAAKQDESLTVPPKKKRQARCCLEENREHCLQKVQTITLLKREKAITCKCTNQCVRKLFLTCLITVGLNLSRKLNQLEYYKCLLQR